MSSRLAHVHPFHVMAILARAQQLTAAGHDVIHMEVGEPDFPTPAPIIEAGRQALADGKTFYTPALGIPALREAIAAFYQQRYGVTVSPRRIAVTTGASGALLLTLSALLAAGDSVLLPDPTYPCNRHLVSLLDAEPRSVAVGPETQYQLNAAHVAAHWQANTVAAMIASPANPTGTLICPTELAALYAAVKAQGGQLIVDEIYHGLTYGVDATTALACADDIWVINSFSKYFQMTGWRLGWLVIPEAYIDAVERVAQNVFLSAPTPAQYAALAAFTPQTIALLEERRQVFHQRRDVLLAAFSDIGFRFPTQPQGAFYAYADVSDLCDNSATLAADLLEHTHVALTPGKDFGQNGATQHIRLAYTCDEARIRQAAARIGEYLQRQR